MWPARRRVSLERLLADRTHDCRFGVGDRALAEQRWVISLLQDGVRPAQALHGLLGRDRPTHDFDQHLRAGRAAEDRRLGLQSHRHVAFHAHCTAAQQHDASDEPLGVCAQNWPQIVLAQVPLRDQRGARMPAELRQLAPDPCRDLCRQIPALGEECHQRFAVRARGCGHEVTIAEQNAANPGAVFEGQGARVARAHDARERAHRVTGAERGGDLELGWLTV